MWCHFAVRTFISNDQSRTHTRAGCVRATLRILLAGIYRVGLFERGHANFSANIASRASAVLSFNFEL